MGNLMTHGGSSPRFLLCIVIKDHSTRPDGYQGAGQHATVLFEEVIARWSAEAAEIDDSDTILTRELVRFERDVRAEFDLASEFQRELLGLCFESAPHRSPLCARVLYGRTDDFLEILDVRLAEVFPSSQKWC